MISLLNRRRSFRGSSSAAAGSFTVDVSGGSYQNFWATGSTSEQWSLAFRPDGLRMYIGINGCIVQYSLSSPFMVETAALEGSHAVNTYVRMMSFSPDGTKVFYCDQLRYMFMATMTTPYDVTTITSNTQNNAPSPPSWFYDFYSSGGQFSPDGKRLLMFVNPFLAEARLQVAFDVSSIPAVYSTACPRRVVSALPGTANYGMIERNPSAHSAGCFSADGHHAFLSGYFEPAVLRHWYMPEAFSLLGAYMLDDSLSLAVTGFALAPYGMAISSDGTKLVILSSNHSVYRFSLPAVAI